MGVVYSCLSWTSYMSVLSVLASSEVDSAAMDWESDSFSLHFKSQQIHP